MPGFFGQRSVEALRQRRDAVDREIAGLVAFRERIDRRIAHLATSPPRRRKGNWRTR